MKYVLLLLLSLSLFSEEKIAKLNSLPNEIRVVVPQHCMFGDFDLILHDSAYNKKINFYLSVKSLNSGQEKVIPVFEEYFPKAVSDESELNKLREKVKDLLNNGVSYQISPEVFTEKGNYIVRICSDSSAEPSCYKKQKVEDIGELLKKYQQPEKGFVPDDHIYFTQVINSDGKNISYLKKSLSEANKKLVKKQFKLDTAVIDELEVLKSFPFIGDGSKLIIGLPVFSKQKCGSAK